MDWFSELFSQGSVAQTVLILCAISIIGLALGHMHIGKIQLGGSMVFFVAIAFGHFAHTLGLETNPAMMEFAKNFGLIVFVYTLGLQVGPGFFSSLSKSGVKVIGSALGTIALASALALTIALTTDIGAPESVGLLSGAVTNTPGLIAAQQTVLDIDPNATKAALNVGSAYAVAYPVSVMGVILTVMLMMLIFPKSAARSHGSHADVNTCVTEVSVCNPAMIGKSVQQAVQSSGKRFVISRLWREGLVHIPMPTTVLQKGDHLLIICAKEDMHSFEIIFGHEEATDWNRPDVDWNSIDENLVSSFLYVTKKEALGKTLGQLKLRNRFGVNITRIRRAGISLVPSAKTTLQFGDRLTVVGEKVNIKALSEYIGNEEIKLSEPHLIPLLLGLFLGVFLGSIPVIIPGISVPIKLGIAGGPIIVGILMGKYGPGMNIITYTSPAANQMIRQLGITFFFACLGFGVGENFVETVFSLQGLKWAGFALIIAVVPIIIMGIFNEKVLKMDFAQNMGVLTGTMTNPNALAYANEELGNENAAEAYATVYPITTFLRIFIAQLSIIALLA